MLIDPYVTEKLRGLDAELARRALPLPGRAPASVLGPLAHAAGRVLRRVGEGLESWAAPVIPESDGARPGVTSQTTRSTFKPREEGC